MFSKNISFIKKESYIKSLRSSRVWHRLLGITLATFLLISAVTGILLALKKDVDVLQPPTQKGESKDLATWKSMSELANLAETAFYQDQPEQKGNLIDRMDVRPSKGIVKILFKKGNWEVQLDGTSGQVKSVAKRHSDWIESLHDGSIVNDIFKLVSMNLLGFGVLFMIGSGLWLWYGPKRYRKLRNK